MSLYNNLFQENEDATALLGMIECTRNMFQRYRDVYLNTKGTIITVLTRLGGLNREDYKQVFKNMERNPNYIKDYDDDYDNTYCYFEFKVPKKYIKTCKMMAPKKERPKIKELFDKEIAESKIPESLAEERMNNIAQQIIDHIMNRWRS